MKIQMQVLDFELEISLGRILERIGQQIFEKYRKRGSQKYLSNIVFKWRRYLKLALLK